MDRASFAGAVVLGLLVLAQAACGGGAAPGSSSSSAAPSAPSAPTAGGTLGLTSSGFANGGALLARYICQARTGLGADTNPPLAWSNAPAGTVGYVLLMSTVANEAGGTVTKYNWVLYDIPALASSIPENNTVIATGNTGTTQVGTPGLTSDGPLYSYSPPCSAAGSGSRSYTFTLYALSAAPVFAFNHAPGAGGDGANLAASLSGITLAVASMVGSYTF